VVSSWADAYSIGEPVKVRHQGSWRRAQVCAVRSRSCMVTLVKSGEQMTANIHDPRNIQSCQPESKDEQSTSNEQLSFG
jgi:hypothetical protein